MTNAALIPDLLMTKKDVATFLKCSLRQVELLTAKGRLPRPIYLGESSPRWKRPELMAALEANQAAE
jgi:predicted DNA-binding transcriptional regulator AlpA